METAPADPPHRTAPLPQSRPPRVPLVTNPWLRFGGVVLGLALPIAALILFVIVLAMVASTNNAPSPFIGDGFLCCGHPDTWNEVALGTVFAAAFAAGSAICVIGAVLLIFNRRMRWGHFALASGLAGALAMVSILVPVAGDLENARTPPDCDGFVVDRRLFRSDPSSKAREEMLLGVDDCGALNGKTTKQVRALLGTPVGGMFRHEPDRHAGVMVYGQLEVSFEHDRVVTASVVSPSSGFD